MTWREKEWVYRGRPRLRKMLWFFFMFSSLRLSYSHRPSSLSESSETILLSISRIQYSIHFRFNSETTVDMKKAEKHSSKEELCFELRAREKVTSAARAASSRAFLAHARYAGGLQQELGALLAWKGLEERARIERFWPFHWFLVWQLNQERIEKGL